MKFLIVEPSPLPILILRFKYKLINKINIKSMVSYKVEICMVLNTVFIRLWRAFTFKDKLDKNPYRTPYYPVVVVLFNEKH